jgi:alpha-galactosidase
VPLQVDLRGVQRLALVADVRGEPYARADWIAPVISYTGEPPVAVAPETAVGEILAPPPAVAPRFNLPAAVGVRPGRPFLQRVNVVGARPIKLSAANLPQGITFDAKRQVLAGVAPASSGEWTIQLSAENSAGRATTALRIVVGETISLTPPQGWSSWYCMSFKISDAWIREAATALMDTGLADHGWNLVKLDEAWMTRPGPDDPRVVRLMEREKRLGRHPGYWKGIVNDPTFEGPARDAQGRILPNARFPDMPALTAWLHERGLQAGIYSSPGVLTCGGCTGSFGHEAEDAAQFAAWGFDFLMYDWCAYSLETDRLEQADWERPYARMGAALRAQPRDIAFNLCQYGHAEVWKWGEKVGGQSWRVDQDLMDTWGAISGTGFFGEDRDQHAGPGRWNDMCFLMLGHIGFGRELHPVKLTRDEQRTHFALWSLRSSPLVLGGDPCALDETTRALLTNDDVIAINRDPLAKPARRVVLDDVREAWVRPLADGTVAVALFNRDEEALTVEVTWTQLGFPGAWRVKDLWRGRPVENAGAGWSGSVPRHGVELFRLEPVVR